MKSQKTPHDDLVERVVFWLALAVVVILIVFLTGDLITSETGERPGENTQFVGKTGYYVTLCLFYALIFTYFFRRWYNASPLTEEMMAYNLDTNLMWYVQTLFIASFAFFLFVAISEPDLYFIMVVVLVVLFMCTFVILVLLSFGNNKQ